MPPYVQPTTRELVEKLAELRAQAPLRSVQERASAYEAEQTYRLLAYRARRAAALRDRLVWPPALSPFDPAGMEQRIARLPGWAVASIPMPTRIS